MVTLQLQQIELFPGQKIVLKNISWEGVKVGDIASERIISPFRSQLTFPKLEITIILI
jgi:hypothetical protein